MKRLTWSALTATVLLSAVAIAAADSPTSSSDDSTAIPPEELALNIEFGKSPIHVGVQYPIKASITNHSDKTITLVQPGDGSSCGWRTPMTGYSILPKGDAKHPDKPKLYSGPRCGNINPLKRDELVVLKPGETMRLSDWFYIRPFQEAGKQRIVFYYVNQPKKTWRGVPLGPHDPEAMKLVKESTPCLLKSREFVIDVQPGKAVDR